MITSHNDGESGVHALRVGPVTITLVSSERSLVVQHGGVVEIVKVETLDEARQLRRWLSAVDGAAARWSYVEEVAQ